LGKNTKPNKCLIFKREKYHKAAAVKLKPVKFYISKESLASECNLYGFFEGKCGNFFSLSLAVEIFLVEQKKTSAKSQTWNWRTNDAVSFFFLKIDRLLIVTRKKFLHSEVCLQYTFCVT
jgi:hypothetical protein